MHAALRVPEVLSLIFNDGSLSHAAVLSMALTCAYWHEIIMEVLWRELPSLVPLFMLMPTDACSIVRHIRSLRIQPHPYRKSIAKALRVFDSDISLILGLRHKSFAPSFAHLAIDIPNSYLEWLSCLTPICSALTAFTFTYLGHAVARRSPADFTACVRAWPALTSISLNSSMGMSQLMPALVLCNSASSPDAVFAPCSPSGAGAYVVGLMKSWGVRQIKRLSVLDLELPADAARALIAGIPTHCEPIALNKRMISATSMGWRMRAEDVASLAMCMGLTSLVLNMSDVADIADVEYETPARSWPLLQRVEFPGSYDRAVAPRCTMAALGTFASTCTQLESIVLSFNANIDVVPSPSLSDSIVTHPNVSYASRVAEHLATLFPSLRWIEDDYDDGRYEESQAGWVMVDAVMRARARAQRAKVWAAERSTVKAKPAAAAATLSARLTSSASSTSASRTSHSSSSGTSYFDALREQWIIA
ncbi:hypothetical protein EV121DRAFT_284298 [Schizophyllum commune]